MKSLSAVIYARTAREDAANIERQTEACVAYADSHGYKIAGIYADNGYSGLDDERPQYVDMKRHLEAMPDHHVIVYTMDRLTRHRSELGQFLRHGLVEASYDEEKADDE